MRETPVKADINVTPLVDVLLESRLRDAIAVRSDKTVFFRIAGDVSYGLAVSAMDAAKGSGADRIGLLGGLKEER